MKTWNCGHPRTQKNTYAAPSTGQERCKKCKNEYTATYMRANRKPKGPWVWTGEGVSVNEVRTRFSTLIRDDNPILVHRRYAGNVALIVPKNVSKSAMLKAWEEMQK